MCGRKLSGSSDLCNKFSRTSNVCLKFNKPDIHVICCLNICQKKKKKNRDVCLSFDIRFVHSVYLLSECTIQKPKYIFNKPVKKPSDHYCF